MAGGSLHGDEMERTSGATQPGVGRNKVQCGMAVLERTGDPQGEGDARPVGTGGEQNGVPAAGWGWGELAISGRGRGTKTFLAGLGLVLAFFDVIGSMQGGECWCSANNRGGLSHNSLGGRGGPPRGRGIRLDGMESSEKAQWPEQGGAKRSSGAKGQRPQWPVAAIPGGTQLARQRRGGTTQGGRASEGTVQQPDECMWRGAGASAGHARYGERQGAAVDGGHWGWGGEHPGTQSVPKKGH